MKIARIRADLTQEALAEKAGLSITHMSNIENGHSKLSLPMAVALANVLSVSVDEFLCDSVIHSKEVSANASCVRSARILAIFTRFPISL